jgi:hypothetical protein
MLKVDLVQDLAQDLVRIQVLAVLLRHVLHQEVDLDLVEVHVKAILGLDQVLDPVQAHILAIAIQVLVVMAQLVFKCVLKEALIVFLSTKSVKNWHVDLH